MAFSDYIKIIGRGKKGSRALTREQAFDAMSKILNGQVSGDQRGAFLMLLRVREETVDELLGFTDACRAVKISSYSTLTADIDIGCYAGKRRHLPWYLLALACLVQKGQKIFIHGTKEQASARVFASDVLPMLGLDIALDAEQAQTSLDTVGAAYVDLANIHPQLHQLILLRQVFGLRSCANTLARLLNPSSANFCVQGVYHDHVDERHHAINQHYDAKALCFRGDAGDPEISPEKDTELFLTSTPNAVTIPSDEKGWFMKDTMDNPQVLLDVWRDECQHDYGVQAILRSLAGYLMLTKAFDSHQARILAEKMWLSRKRTILPFEARSNTQINAA